MDFPKSDLWAMTCLKNASTKKVTSKARLCLDFGSTKPKNIKFVLVVDDFGIKYLKKEDLDHLIKSFLEQYYDATVDLEGKEYVKIELDWDYEKRQVHLSMMPYLQKALRQFDNVVPTKREDSPYPHIEPKYMEPSNNLSSMTHPPLLEKKNKVCSEVDREV
jgi:hypothetical protein